MTNHLQHDLLQLLILLQKKGQLPSSAFFVSLVYHLKTSGKVYTAADVIYQTVLFVAHLRYGIRTRRAIIFSCIWHLFLQHPLTGYPYTTGFEEEVQFAISQALEILALHFAPTFLDRSAISRHATVIVLQSCPPELLWQPVSRPNDRMWSRSCGWHHLCSSMLVAADWPQLRRGRLFEVCCEEEGFLRACISGMISAALQHFLSEALRKWGET